MVQWPELDGKNAEERAPHRVGMADAHHVGAGAQHTGVDGPLVRRGLSPAQIVPVTVQHDQLV